MRSLEQTCRLKVPVMTRVNTHKGSPQKNATRLTDIKVSLILKLMN